MVERVCPTIERQRAAKAERAAEKRAKRSRKRKVQEIQTYLYAGIHMKQELHRVARLSVFKGSFKGKMPDLRLTDKGAWSSNPNYVRGSNFRRGLGVEHKTVVEIEHHVDADPAAIKAAMLVQLVLMAKGHDDLTTDRIGAVAKAAYQLDEYNIAGCADWWDAENMVADQLRAKG